MKGNATIIKEEDISKINEEQYFNNLKILDPEVYMIKVALEETEIDPMIITHVIRSLGNLTLGAGYGKVQIYMHAKIVTNIESTEKVKLDGEAVETK